MHTRSSSLGRTAHAIQTLRIEIDVPVSVRKGIQELYENDVRTGGQGLEVCAQGAFEHYATGLVRHREAVADMIGKLLAHDHVQIQHLEHIIPDFHLPIHALLAIKNASRLESLSIQYKLTDTGPGSTLPPSYITPHVASFISSLLISLQTLPNIRRIRLSLPHTYQPPYASFLDVLIDSALGNPGVLPTIETVDLTHSAPRYHTILRVLRAHPRTLKHLILDQGIEFDMPVGERVENGDSDSDGDSSVVVVGEVQPGSDDPLYFTWAGVGSAISTLRKEHGPNGYALESLSMAKCEVNMWETSLFPTPMGSKEVLEMLRSGKTTEKEDIEVDLGQLIFCAVWPGEESKELEHTKGCGHLAGWSGGFKPKDHLWQAMTWLAQTRLL